MWWPGRGNSGGSWPPAFPRSSNREALNIGGNITLPRLPKTLLGLKNHERSKGCIGTLMGIRSYVIFSTSKQILWRFFHFLTK